MRKFLGLLLLIAYVFSFLISFQITDNEQLGIVENVENQIAKKFTLPNNSILSNPKDVYPVLNQVASDLSVNIFRPTVSYKNNNIEISKYVLITGETSFFNFFSVKSGRNLSANETQEVNYFLSSKDTNEENQIGIIDDFGNNDAIAIYPLNQSYSYLPVYGEYFVEVSNDKLFNTFIETLTSKLNDRFNGEFTNKDFIADFKESESFDKNSNVFLNYIKYIVFIIIVIFLIYYIFNNAKSIGIMKLHGTSNIRIWFFVIGKLILFTFVLSTGLSLVISIFLANANMPFISNILINQITTLLIIILLSLISYIYISRIKVSGTIKNKKDTNGILVLNYIFKVVCVIALVFMGNYIFERYSEITQKKAVLKNWEISKEYGMFYPFEVGYDSDEVKDGLPRTTRSIDSLYPILNNMGSIFINTRDYEEMTLIQDKNFNGIRSIRVNPNYLKEFQVLKTDNSPINVAEDEINWVLLVPEKYKKNEDDILRYFKERRKENFNYDKGFLKSEIPNNILNQEVKIIWTKSNQEIFSFNPEVFKKENNMIIDPIIEVITEKNSLVSDRELILGNGGTDPLKVKLINGDSSHTYRTLYPKLVKLKLDDNLGYIVNIDQLVLNQIYEIGKEINNLLFISAIVLIGFLILLIQSLIVFFSKYEQKFTVYRLFGVGFFSTYKNYFLVFLMTWILQLIIWIVINKDLDFNKYLIILLVAIELIASYITIYLLEKKNMVRVLKGG